jgi:putative hydrolase of the HAD superfamily
MLETLDAHEPGHCIAADALAPSLENGFPWHTPEVPHPELCDPTAWWRHVEKILAGAFEGVGYHGDRAAALARLAHERFVDGTLTWQLYPETLETLGTLRKEGWDHVVLTNHVPELEEIVRCLGLHDLVSAVVNSAVTGYEKPHPKAFEIATTRAQCPTNLWMVGDNPEADARGAERAGIRAILVRRDDPAVRRRAAVLRAAAALIRGEPATAPART